MTPEQRQQIENFLRATKLSSGDRLLMVRLGADADDDHILAWQFSQYDLLQAVGIINNHLIDRIDEDGRAHPGDDLAMQFRGRVAALQSLCFALIDEIDTHFPESPDTKGGGFH